MQNKCTGGKKINQNVDNRYLWIAESQVNINVYASVFAHLSFLQWDSTFTMEKKRVLFGSTLTLQKLYSVNLEINFLITLQENCQLPSIHFLNWGADGDGVVTPRNKMQEIRKQRNWARVVIAKQDTWKTSIYGAGIIPFHP